MARNGEDAVKAALAEKPDLILMDISLTGKMDGIEAAKVISEQIPVQILFTTDHKDEEILIRAKSSTKHNLLLKPFKGHELKSAIETALSADNK
jgi:DNA-binding NarL/FixJ family response regulator